MAPINKTNGKSSVWKIWNWVLDEEDNIISDKIACIHCNTVRDYEGTTEGTENFEQKSQFHCCRTMK